MTVERLVEELGNYEPGCEVRIVVGSVVGSLVLKPESVEIRYGAGHSEEDVVMIRASGRQVEPPVQGPFIPDDLPGGGSC